MTSEVKLKTGGDPRSLPDYAALRDEISKLTHPARPDVDWRYVETLCLRLNEHNGVELQTASWYTVAWMHTTGLSGLSERQALIVVCINPEGKGQAERIASTIRHNRVRGKH